MAEPLASLLGSSLTIWPGPVFSRRWPNRTLSRCPSTRSEADLQSLNGAIAHIATYDKPLLDRLADVSP